MYGLVLEGGGAKGAYHIGALKALEELNIEIEAVAGTSIGAMNGAMFVQNKLDLAYDYWYNISTSKVLDIEDQYLSELLNLSINQNNISYFIKKAKEVLQNRGLDNSFLKEILENNIDEESLRNSEIDFAIVTLSLSDLKPLELFIDDIPKGKVIDYIMASSYLPAFKMQRIDGKILIDGGFYENLPLNTLLNKGYKKIIAIRTYGLGEIEKRVDDNKEIIFINPSQELGRMLNFDQKNARKNIKMGYFDTMRYFKGLAGKKYYLNIKKDESFFVNYLLNLDEKVIKKLLKQLSLTEEPYFRSFFENLIPKLVNLLEISYQANYTVIVIRLLEELAAYLKIDRYKIYTFEELLRIVRENYQKKDKKLSSKLPAFIKTSSLLPKQIKEDLILDIAEKLFI
ncbi:patatin-like phospholipase family protein [Halanaerobium congolense]|jgi:NTE family protein|uniref:NTE family protein n=1 Tax=Halanaerobium congolense TaxID=54121 RepID=A0A1G6PEY9_9FIRM|nr:patatin-like phospholipase family protein [Halanaerobium congolense]KXS50513.1 MAG: NTE family protein [Halanaerobium sp. T82-1]PUU91399.1 MAG: NTE family protein [Halanaerobium sp.]PTX16764.1 NTE family protein [Halanaerobium congolense]PXV66429.1 NTE family protein [Halanaerobium congolense]TDP15614.1 NTE family protein [Halanaerobium congolense]